MREALDDFRDLDLNRYPHDVLLDRIWELRHNASAYDAAYLTLAEILDAPLLTTDAASGRSRGHPRGQLIACPAACGCFSTRLNDWRSARR